MAPEGPIVPPPPIRCTQEIRFAVVMYGGVSLAIYINGIAQELLRLVRSTASVARTGEGSERALVERPQGTEKIYRELGQMLERGRPPRAASAGDPVRTRFVIDVLSGTSAGGINAVFLAKALANEQPLESLKDLWIREGDIGRLLNDGASVRDLAPLAVADPPKSLLNGQRMYAKLLEAFRGMDDTPAAPESRLVEDLELFVTTTDVRGGVVALRLADRVVFERRHRSVFRFRYDARGPDGAHPLNDFGPENNPVLAFASRCTSAFPFAFEPMSAADTVPVLRTQRSRSGVPERAVDEPTLGRYLRGSEGDVAADPSGGQRPAYGRRTFADGGYLDNKPFSYAIEALAFRRSSLPVDRKLIYVEPSPEHPERASDPEEKPDAIQNVQAALMGVPRNETIREDLQRVLARNRLAERVERIFRGLEDDVDRGESRELAPAGADFADMDLSVMMRRYGLGYGGYHRLKVAAVTDDIARAFTRTAGFDEHSDQCMAIRYVVGAWRDRHYAHYREDEGKDRPRRATFNRFLLDYDLDYRIRRLGFVRNRLDMLACVDDRADRILAAAGLEYRPRLDAKGEEAFREAVGRLRGELERVLAFLVRNRLRLQGGGARKPLARFIAGMGLSRATLELILDQPSEGARVAYVERLIGYDGPGGNGARERTRAFADAASFLGQRVRRLCVTASREVGETFERARGPGGAAGAAAACLRHYYDRFEDYDFIAYPTLYSTEVGEERDPVEVFRISPEDATSLLDEAKTGRPKLAGAAVHHFGAFFDESWRYSDILWGRLDGAERIISALLPGTHLAAQRDRLIERAHLEILAEEFRREDRQAIADIVARSAWREQPRERSAAALAELVRRRHGSAAGSAVLNVLRAAVETTDLREHLRGSAGQERTLDRATLLRNVARATRIAGRMLEDLAGRRGAQGIGTWIARAGTLFWGVVEMAVPESLWNVVARHHLKLLIALELVLVAGGIVLGNADIRNFGAVTLALTAALRVVVWALEDFMRQGGWLRRLGAPVAATLAAAVIALAAVGLRTLTGWGLEWAGVRLESLLLVWAGGVFAYLAVRPILAGLYRYRQSLRSGWWTAWSRLRSWMPARAR